MIDPHIRMRHLRTFLETARLGSLSAAADALHVSQPAASKTIRELEDILGSPLFDRSGRRLQLTRAGKTFQQHAGGAMTELERAQDLVRSVARQQTRIAVGALPTASTEIFPRAALAFREVCPDCVLRVSTGPNWLLLTQLREGTLDMVVGRMAHAGMMEGLSFRQLYPERVVPVVRPGHPVLGRDNPLAALAEYPLMLPPSGAVISPMVRAFLHTIGLPSPRPAFENVSHAFGRKVVSESDTVWFISRGVVAEELNLGTLVAIDVTDDLLGGSVGVSMRQQTIATDEQRVLLDLLVEAAQDLGQ